MELLFKKILESEKEMINFGEKILKNIKEKVNLIIIKGDLGTGKTTLVKGIAKSLKIEEDIISPTYGYKREYDGMIHYDLYLTKKMKSKELEFLISEDLEDNLVIIEWGEKLPKINDSIIITIESLADHARLVKVNKI